MYIYIYVVIISTKQAKLTSTNPASSWPQAVWWEKDSTIRHSTLCCWRCPCPGKAHCSNTPAACIGNRAARQACESSTGSISAIRSRNGCGSDGCGAIGPWATRCLQISYRWQASERKLLTDLLTSKPEGIGDPQRRKRFGRSIEKLPKLNVAGSSPVTRF